MKFRKFVAPSPRLALQLVRDALGSEAVIVSTREDGGRCEILALAYAEAQRLATGSAAPKPPVPRGAPGRDEVSAVPLQSWARRRFSAVVDDEPDDAPGAPEAAPRAQPLPAEPRPVPAVPPQPVLEELRELRALIASQAASIAWMESGHRRPLRATLMREMLAAGFSAWFARELTGRLPDDYSAARAREWVRQAVQSNVACAAAPETMLESARVVALVGPTGAGKTTTTAKLAARCVVRYGAQAVGLVSTDTYRIGAQDQLRIYGRILGVPVEVCHDEQSLRSVLSGWAARRVVLVDTVGMGQRDPRVREQTAMLEACGASRVLLLNAALQADVLDQVADAYAGPGAAAALTKLDEAVTLGGALEVAIRRRLTLQFLTSGQRVPEDLHAAQAMLLAHRALRVPHRPWAAREDEYALVAAASGMRREARNA